MPSSVPDDDRLLAEAARILADPKIRPYPKTVLHYIAIGWTGTEVRADLRLHDWEAGQLAGAVDMAITAGITPDIARHLLGRYHPVPLSTRS